MDTDYANDIELQANSPTRAESLLHRLEQTAGATKGWNFIDRLSIIWKSNLSDKAERIFLSRIQVDSSVWMHHMDTDKVYRKKVWRKLLKNATNHIEQILEATSHKTEAVRLPTSHL